MEAAKCFGDGMVRKLVLELFLLVVRMSRCLVGGLESFDSCVRAMAR